MQAVQFAVPGAQPVRPAVPVETVTAIQGAGESDRARNDTARDSSARTEQAARAMKDRAADPAEPKGPPPSFAANVLEAERARLKEGEGVEAEREVRVSDASAAEPAPAPEVRADAVGEAREVESSDAAEDRSDAARDDRAEARDAPAPTRSAYGGVKEDAPRMLDVSR